MESSRKRKRPSYLQDFYDPSLIVEEPVLKKTVDQKAELKQYVQDIEEPVLKKPVDLEVESKPSLKNFEEQVFKNRVDLKVDSKQYLQDFDDSSLIVKEPEVEKKVELIVEPIEEPKQYCSLCGKFTESASIVWDMATTTGASSSTFASVLEKLVTEEQLIQMAKNSEFLAGFLCLVCKDYVIALDRLQNEVVEVKKSILWLFKNNEHIEKKNMVEQEKAEAIYQTMVGKWKKVGDSDNLETNNKSEMTQIQQKNYIKETLPNITILNKKNELPLSEIPNEKKEKEKVESLLEKRGYKYLVKWKNCSAALNSWEARFALPQLIVKYYEEDISRLGTAAPDNLEEVNDDTESDEDDSETEESESEEEEEAELKNVQNIQQPDKLIEHKTMSNIKNSDISFRGKTETPTTEVNLHHIPDGLKSPSQTIFEHKLPVDDIPKSTLKVFKASNDTKSTLPPKKETMIIEKPDMKSLKAKKDKIGLDCWITKPKPNIGKTIPMIETTNSSNEKGKEDETNGTKDTPNEELKQNNPSDNAILSPVKTKKSGGENSVKKGVKENKQEMAKVNIISKPDIEKTKSLTVKAKNSKAPIKDPANKQEVASEDITIKPKRVRKKKTLITEEEDKEFIIKANKELEPLVASEDIPINPKRARKKKTLITDEEDEEFIIKATKELAPVVASEDIPIKPKRARKTTPVIVEDDEEEFIVEALLEKKGSKFLVKWETYSEVYNSWEPKSGIPEFIVKYYEEDLSRLGTPAPSELEEEGDGSKEEDHTDVEKILEK